MPKNANRLKQTKSLLIALLLIVVSPVSIQAYEEFGEVGDPTMQHGIQAMRSYMSHYFNYVFYTMNMSTPGAVEVGVYNSRLKNADGSYRIDHVPFYRFRSGPPIRTDNMWDFYVNGYNRAFFVVQLTTSLGYTRDGRFELDSQRRLVTRAGGYPVIGENGPIIMPEGSDLSGSRSGVLFMDGQPVDRLKVIVFKTGLEGQKMEMINASMFVLTEEAEVLEGPEHYVVKQGMLHENNVLKALNGDMLFAKQGYDASTKAVQVLAKSLTTISSLGAQ